MPPRPAASCAMRKLGGASLRLLSSALSPKCIGTQAHNLPAATVGGDGWICCEWEVSIFFEILIFCKHLIENVTMIIRLLNLINLITVIN